VRTVVKGKVGIVAVPSNFLAHRGQDRKKSDTLAAVNKNLRGPKQEGENEKVEGRSTDQIKDDQEHTAVTTRGML